MGIKKIAAGALLAAFTAVAGLAAPALAQEQPTPRDAVVATATSAQAARDALQYSSAFYLAYVAGPSSQINDEAKAGLEALSAALTKRTAVEPAGVAALNPEKDDLSLFPFIYWPVSADAQPLSEAAQKNVQNYINTGGVILFDTRDQGAVSQNAKALQGMLQNVSIRQLVPMGEDHTLTKSFYLVAGIPGSYSEGTVWVEAQDVKGSKSVSSVIIGGNNWAGAWSGTLLATGTKEKEMAMRAGINIVMYALTGTYKDDLAHIPQILERLDKPGR